MATPEEGLRASKRCSTSAQAKSRFILVAALLLLGPERLPELARGIGKFMREFRRQTDDVRSVVEREFYKMDQEVFAEDRASPADRAPAPRRSPSSPRPAPASPARS